MDFNLCLEKREGAEISMDSNRFALLKRVTLYFFKLCWAYPLVYILVCSCGFVGFMFPNVFQCLVSFILLFISTYLFLAAFVSSGPPLSQSLNAEPAAGEKSAESHEGEGNEEKLLQKFYVVSRQGETQIASCHENVETVKESKQEFEDIIDINNGGRNLLKFKCEEVFESFEANGVQEAHETSSRNPLGEIVLEDEDEKESNPVDERIFPLALGTIEEEPAAKEEEEAAVAQEKDNERKHRFIFLEGEGGGIGGNDIRLEDFFSGWKSQFESSADSLSEASSLGDLDHLLDELDPLLLTDEEKDEADDPNASTKAQGDEDDRPAFWPSEDEGLFDLVHHHCGSDSESMFSEDDNLIEIEISKNQVLDDNKNETHEQWKYIGDSQTEERNLIDLDSSEDDKLQGQNLTNYLFEEGGASANFPEEENLIEIDLSAHTVSMPLLGTEDKVSPINICAEKIVPRVDVPPATVVDLIDLNSPSILEMNMAGSEDEQCKPEKTESFPISITKKIQDPYIANLLD